jgi:hypothetical protein
MEIVLYDELFTRKNIMPAFTFMLFFLIISILYSSFINGKFTFTLFPEPDDVLTMTFLHDTGSVL